MPTQRILVVGDIHVPYQDTEVFNGLLAFARDFKPTGLILNGDGVDFYDLSKYNKNPQRCGRLSEEREQLHDEILVPLLRACRDPMLHFKVYNQGNHERRLCQYLWHQAPALSGLKEFKDAGTFLQLEKLGFEYRDENNPYELGHLLVMHGHMIRKHSGWSAKAHYERYGTSILMGHSHRWGHYSVTDWRGVHSAVEHGCLCRLDPEYMPHPNWQQGWAVVHVFENGLFSIQEVKVINREFVIFGDKQYEVKGAK